MTSTGPAAGAHALDYALFDVGPLRVGVLTSSVVQAIPRPEALTSIPRSRHALEGVFTLRGSAVPLLNLQRWMTSDGTADAAPDPQTSQILVLRADNKSVGIVVTAVKGMLKVQASDVHQVHHDSDPAEFFHSVAVGGDKSSLVTLLDVRRLVAQAQVWAAAESGDSRAALDGTDAGVQASPDTTEAFAVVRLGRTLLGVPGSAVGEVVSGGDIQKMFGMSKEFIGMTRWRHKDVPVLDLAHALGAPQLAADAPKWLLVMHAQDDCMAFLVDDICAVTSFPSHAVQLPNDAAGGIDAHCSGSCMHGQGERVYLLKPQALFGASPLSRLGADRSTNRDLLRLSHTLSDDAASEALIVFKSKLTWAAPMRAMHQIVKVPDALNETLRAAQGSTGTGADVVAGSIEFKGLAVPLIDLRLTFDSQRSAMTDRARVIFVNLGVHMAGLIVEEVLALIPGHTASRSQFASQGMRIDMVTVGHGGEQKSYRIFDIAALGLRLSAPV